jgi:hypothetical protein
MAADADSPEGQTTALQLDRGLFSSKEEFIEGNDHDDARPIPDVGVAAFIVPIDDGGWGASVLLDESNSFALVAPERADRTQVVRVAREIADRFHA